MNANATPASLSTEIVLLRDRATQILQEIEEHNRRANSEAGFAFNAKGMAEEHAKAIAGLKGSAEAESGWLATTRDRVEETVTAITAAKSAVETAARQAGEYQQSAEGSHSKVAAVVEAVSTLVPQVEEAARSVATALAAAKADAGTAAAATATTKELSEKAQATSEALSSALEGANEAVESINDHHKTTTELLVKMQTLLDKSEKALGNVAAYEKRLGELVENYEETHKKIEGLLPNATSAGLASAFRNQKARFVRPQMGWLVGFVTAIVGLLVAGFVGLPTSTENWDAILRHTVNRLPFVIPLVWLAIYAGRHYNMALRVQEEYAFKEAVSTAFEGYKREMGNLRGAGDGIPAPLLQLCDNVLRAVSERPGRIYEGKPQDITPFTPVIGAMGEAAGTAIGGVVKKAPDNK